MTTTDHNSCVLVKYLIFLFFSNSNGNGRFEVCFKFSSFSLRMLSFSLVFQRSNFKIYFLSSKTFEGTNLAEIETKAEVATTARQSTNFLPIFKLEKVVFPKNGRKFRF